MNNYAVTVLNIPHLDERVDAWIVNPRLGEATFRELDMTLDNLRATVGCECLASYDVMIDHIHFRVLCDEYGMQSKTPYPSVLDSSNNALIVGTSVLIKHDGSDITEDEKHILHNHLCISKVVQINEGVSTTYNVYCVKGVNKFERR